MSRDVELLTEIRDLLQVMAEPLLAKRDEKRRSALRNAAGSSAKKKKAIQLMDGTRTRPDIVKQSEIDPAELSRLIKVLAGAQLVIANERHPRIALKVPPNFFDEGDE